MTDLRKERESDSKILFNILTYDIIIQTIYFLACKFYNERPFVKILLKRIKTKSSDKGETNASGTAGVNLSHVVENRRK